jgi:molecular chaperone DnaK (HSP70)
VANTDIVFGIDLGTTYSCIAYVDEYGKPVVIPNVEGDRTTPSVVQFEGTNRIVGKEAKNNAVLYPNQVVEMVKRHMGTSDWVFTYEGVDYRPEEISSYILRKLVGDAEQYLGQPIKEVVITCPAYFGIAQREATARAGQIAGLNVREVINEPTAAAIMYGLQSEKDQVVLVFDLGGGTFDITVIEIKGGAITVVATGGDHYLGGRNWDGAIVQYLAQEWVNETGSSEDPTDSAETQQDLWNKAESAKRTLSARQETTVPVMHAGERVGVKLTREKFDELTAGMLERAIEYTKTTIAEAAKRGYSHYDQILLVGGSTKMPQVVERLQKEFPGIPQRSFDPDEAVAKGAAIYGQKLMLDEKIQIKIAEMTGQDVEDVNAAQVPQQVKERAQQEVARESGLRTSVVEKFNAISVTNVSSHCFGVIALNRAEQEIIANMILVNDPLPFTKTETFYTVQANQQVVDVQVMENSVSEYEVSDITLGEEIGNATLHLPPRLPLHAPIEVTFELNQEGRLHVTAREVSSNRLVDVTIQIKLGIPEEELAAAQARATRLSVS